MPRLYLIPSPISREGIDHIPPVAVNAIEKLAFFCCERARTTRRYVKQLIPNFSFENKVFVELDKHKENPVSEEVMKLFDGVSDVGLLSESGMPCIADPGELVVDFARNHGYTIVPLSGPSSILLALTASGLNSEQFVFHGYLPLKTEGLQSKLVLLSKEVNRTSYTHIFIETPYRNQKLLESIRQKVSGTIRLCVAQNLTGDTEKVTTATIADWNKKTVQLEKAPTIFLLGK